MSEVEFAGFVAAAIPAYAADTVASGQWAAEESLELSRMAFEELLPLGLDTPDSYLFAILDERGNRVGTIWLAAKEQAGKRIAYICDIMIYAEFRRRGHATRALAAIETEARRLGLSGIALHVFGHNLGARALYEAVGYRATNISMFKPL
jgi:ribosomal protein S18 acetylase RimI-like enzyme